MLIHIDYNVISDHRFFSQKIQAHHITRDNTISSKTQKIKYHKKYTTKYILICYYLTSNCMKNKSILRKMKEMCLFQYRLKYETQQGKECKRYSKVSVL